MVEAAATGALDFKLADPSDDRWWLQLRLVLDRLERKLLGESRERRTRIQLAVLSRAGTDPAAAKELLKHCQDDAERMDELAIPWIGRHASNSQSANEALSAAWIAEHGDPNDPETQAKIAATVAYLDSLNKADKMIP